MLTAWNAIDLLASDHALSFGRPGTVGQRAANFIFQNADLLISLGCRLNLRQIGYTFPSVARAAYKVVVDIDPVELSKPTFTPDLPIICDVGELMARLEERLSHEPLAEKTDWLAWCRARRARYPWLSVSTHESTVDPYLFSDTLAECLALDDIVVSSNGASCVIPIQVMRLTQGQRHLVNSGCASMGYGLPAAVGACFAHGQQRIICLEGDGSIQMNLQELQTLIHHRLPVKLFLFSNGGYLSIRTTQQGYFAGNAIGESAQSGVSFPDMVKVATAYDIPAFRISEHAKMRETIQQVLTTPGPVLCDVCMATQQAILPRIASQRLADGRLVSSPLEDMSPLLERDEFAENMLIPAWY